MTLLTLMGAVGAFAFLSELPMSLFVLYTSLTYCHRSWQRRHF